MSEVAIENKQIAKFVAELFGGQPQVNEFTYDFTKNKVNILSCMDAPQEGVTSYATVDLSRYPLIKDGEDFGVRLEIVGACATRVDYFANLIASAAACIHYSKMFCAPGIVFPDLIKQYNRDIEMQHIMFVPPFLWDSELQTRVFGDRKVAWLLALPISDQELEYAKKSGPDKLENIFEEKQIDVFDIQRRSVL